MSCFVGSCSVFTAIKDRKQKTLSQRVWDVSHPMLSTTHPGMVGSKVASDIELILVGGAGCVVSKFVGSNRLPAAENVGSIFASTLSTAKTFVSVDKGGRGETERGRGYR